jgi:prepilin-type N-terminal cleavage/methylation domain-containing protein
MTNRRAFTLLEVLISIALLGIVIIALFSAVDMMQNSNEHLAKHLQKSKKITKATKVLYLDMMGSDGNITIHKDEFSRVCIHETRNSMYALPTAKVCWVVLKENNTLVRTEGSLYHLPLNDEERVEVDPVMSDIEVFDVYHEKDKILVIIQQKAKEPITFMLQGITMPAKKQKSADSNTTASATK